MDNVQNCDSYINIPSSQTYRKMYITKVKRKVKFPCAYLIKHYAMKTYDVYSDVSLTSALVVNGQLHAPAASLPGKEPRYPLDRRLGGPQHRN
jgi:hypothetical protein